MDYYLGLKKFDKRILTATIGLDDEFDMPETGKYFSCLLIFNKLNYQLFFYKFQKILNESI